MATTEQRNRWRVEFPLGDKVVRLDMAAPLTAERADVIVTAYAALSSVGTVVDPFEATAECLGAE